MKHEIEKLLAELSGALASNPEAVVTASSVKKALEEILAVDQPDTSMHEMD